MNQTESLFGGFLFAAYLSQPYTVGSTKERCAMSKEIKYVAVATAIRWQPQAGTDLLYLGPVAYENDEYLVLSPAIPVDQTNHQIDLNKLFEKRHITERTPDAVVLPMTVTVPSTPLG